MAETGAGVIAYKSGGSTNPEILIVRESKFLVDILPNANKNTVASLQAITDKNAELEAEFTKRIDTIKASLPKGMLHNIHYNTPTQPSVHYRIPANKLGLPKGGKEKKDRGDLIKTAMREFKEEIGIVLDKKKFNQFISIRDGTDIYKFFLYELSLEEITAIESAIEMKKSTHYSEVFDVHFERLESILTKDLNVKSNNALLEFQRQLNLPPTVSAAAPAAVSAVYVPPGKRQGFTPPAKLTGFPPHAKSTGSWRRSTRKKQNRRNRK